MKKTTTILLATLLMVLMVGCSEKGGFKKTRSGLSYKIISDGKGPLVKKGELIKIHFSNKVRDSVLGTTYGSMPTYAQVDSVGPDYNPAEIFSLLRKGDSAVIILEIDTLMKRNPGQLPPSFKAKDKMVLTIRVLEILPSREAVQQDQMEEMAKQKQKDESRKVGEIKEIEEYLSKNNIKAQQTKSGVFYEIQNPGTGPQADSGKIVSINYTGYLMDGKFFDSNVDSNKQLEKHPLTPFEFMAGVQGAIPGMLEGVTVFKEGGKGRIFIPSVLGYGGQGSPPVIKPYQNLFFEIEVTSVKDAPPQQGMPQMPMPQPPQQR
ncbi:MAG: FKBP-type peptidyl-prolyl cis-trans isomerase [Chitinophagaceae bacterium]|nr:FKBP-type peptidyl-prolyl cis-trans isomerase [Chitinophagaceae bacterium]